MKKSYLQIGSLCVGAMDAMTGLLLVLCPALVLRLLGVGGFPADSLVYMSWIGAFVLSVGLGYGFVLRGTEAAKAVWCVTALARAIVCVFIVAQVAMGKLVAPWLLVAATDGIVACVQVLGLKAKWWENSK